VRRWLAITQASKIAEKWASRASEGGFFNGIWLPELRAAIELKQGNAARAVELLAPVKGYESGWIDRYMAAYLRGQAYLAAPRGVEAAAEFQKILDHRGVVLDSIIGALAHVGLARAYLLQGDVPRSRAAYEDFFNLWRDADKDVPNLVVAKSPNPNTRNFTDLPSAVSKQNQLRRNQQGSPINGKWRLFQFPRLQYYVKVESIWNADARRVVVIY